MKYLGDPEDNLQLLVAQEERRKLEFRIGRQEIEIVKLKKEIKEWKRKWYDQFDVDAMGGN